MLTALWSIDSGDTRGLSADGICGAVVDRVRPGDIVLLHDGGQLRPATLEAAPRILDGLTRRGYEFVTISELLVRAGIELP